MVFNFAPSLRDNWKWHSKRSGTFRTGKRYPGFLNKTADNGNVTKRMRVWPGINACRWRNNGRSWSRTFEALSSNPLNTRCGQTVEAGSPFCLRLGGARKQSEKAIFNSYVKLPEGNMSHHVSKWKSYVKKNFEREKNEGNHCPATIADYALQDVEGLHPCPYDPYVPVSENGGSSNLWAQFDDHGFLQSYF